MSRRYVLAPEAAHDLVQIWRYIKKNASLEMADRVESVIRDKIVYLAERPGGGHWRKDLTDEPVKFFPVYSYLIVYRPETSPLPSCRHSPWPPRRGGASQGSLINRTRFLFAAARLPDQRACASQKSVALCALPRIQVDWAFQKLVDRFLNHLFDGKPLLGSDDFQLLQGPLRNR